MPSYIFPPLKFYSSIRELKEEAIPEEMARIFGGKGNLEFADLLRKKKIFVLGEPGYGKSRLLQEIVVRANRFSVEAMLINLKKINLPLSEYIENKVTSARNVEDLTELGALCDLNVPLKTKSFHLENRSEVTVCLDALDEVSQERFADVVDWIKDFAIKFPDIVLIISCRRFYFLKYEYLFSNSDFSYVELLRFSRRQVHKYLAQFELGDGEIRSLIESVTFGDRAAIIQVPRYLEMSASLIKEKGLEFVKTLDRIELFENFIYGALRKEGHSTRIKKNEMTKRVLEKLALILEIYQDNVITKDELMTFFDDIDSNLCAGFLRQVPLEIFYEKSLLKDHGETIEFHNKEFQEYLAAKEICRLGRVDQTVFDLMVDQELREFYPSWFNTLSFLIDLEPKLKPPLLLQVLRFLEGKGKQVQDETFHQLLSKADAEKLGDTDRKYIFEKVFRYYQIVLHRLRYKVAKNLAYYFHPSQIQILKDYMNVTYTDESVRQVRLGNVANLVRFVIGRSILGNSEHAFWKATLVGFANDSNSSGELQQYSILALAEFKEISLLKSASVRFGTGDEAFDQDFIAACMEVDPNDKYSVLTFVTGLKKSNIVAGTAIEGINKKESLLVFLECLITDSVLLRQFIEFEKIFKENYEVLLENLRRCFDNDIKEKLERLILAAFMGQLCWFARNSEVLIELTKLLSQRNTRYVFELLDAILQEEAYFHRFHSFEHVFSSILKKVQVKELVERINRLSDGGVIAFRLLHSINASGSTDAHEIYEEGKKYLAEEYRKAEDTGGIQPVKEVFEQNVVAELRNHLQMGTGDIDPEVFSFYLEHREILKRLTNVSEKDQIKRILVDKVFEVFDPSEGTLKILRREGGNTNYQIAAFIPLFGTCLKLIAECEELRVDVTRYRQKILNFIPFSYDEELEIIFALVPNPTEVELQNLLAMYDRNRTDDLHLFMPRSLIEATVKYKIVNAIPLLKAFVNNHNISFFDREAALNAIAKITPDSDYLDEVFTMHVSASDWESIKIAEAANRHLIEIHQSSKAINWRFKQLKERVFAFVQPEGVHTVDETERELRDKNFAAPLLALADPALDVKFLELLEFSFSVFEQGEMYRPYCSYLWDIVFNFFNNIRESRSYVHIKKLEDFVVTHSGAGGLNWFKYRLSELKRSYLAYIGKPRSIEMCIKRFNELKKNQYLDVATSRDLVEMVEKIVKEDLKKWVEEEGAYRMVEKVKRGQENLIQKTLISELKNALHGKGIRKDEVREVRVVREAKLLDDKQTDFLLFYGFIGPVLIETKRLSNPEVKNAGTRHNYRTKLLNYIEGTGSHFGIFLLFRTKVEDSLDRYLSKVREVYQNDRQITVLGLDCIKPLGKSVKSRRISRQGRSRPRGRSRQADGRRSGGRR